MKGSPQPYSHMTVRSLLETLCVEERAPISLPLDDGKRPGSYVIVIELDGHGKPLDAFVDNAHVYRDWLGISAHPRKE